MEKNQQIHVIDNRVAQLERINDAYIADHGYQNERVYNLIQELMDERDALIQQME